MEMSFLQKSVRGDGFGSDETLKLIDDLEGFQVDHHKANFDRFHLIGDDLKRPWRFPIFDLIAGCLT